MIFCHCQYSLQKGWVGWAVGIGWGILGTAMTPVGAHTMDHALLVGHVAMMQYIVIISIYHPIGTLHWCHCSSRDFGGLAK